MAMTTIRPPATSRDVFVLMTNSSPNARWALFKRKQSLPIVLHADYDPATHRGSRHRVSGLELPTLEFRSSRPEVAEMINGRPHRRKCERFELLVQHLLQVFLRGDADRDVWIEFPTRFVRDEICHVIDGRLVDVGVFLGGDVRRRG